MERSAESLAYWVKRFERPMVGAASLVLIGMCLRVAFRDDAALHMLGNVLADGAWVVFLVAWLVLFGVSPDRRRFLLSHKFLTLIVVAGPVVAAANLITPLPGLVAASTLLRLAPLGRWLLNRGSLGYLIALGALVIVAAALSFWQAENTTFGEALYWSSTASLPSGPSGPPSTHPETMVMEVFLGFLGIGFFAAVVSSLTRVITTREQSARTDATVLHFDEEIVEIEELVEEAAERAEDDIAMLAQKLEALTATLDTRLTALEQRLAAADEPRHDA